MVMLETVERLVQEGHNVKCRVYLGTNQSYSDNSTTKVNLDTVVFDTGSDFDTTNKRFIAPVTGYYFVSAACRWAAGGTADRVHNMRISVNNTEYFRTTANTVSTNEPVTLSLSEIVYLEASQYVEMFGYQNSGGSKNLLAGSSITAMSIFLIGTL